MTELSLKANGFYGSRGISGRIPEGYTFLEQRFMRAVQVAGRGRGRPGSQPVSDRPVVDLQEWEKEGWTYHAKGMMLSYITRTTLLMHFIFIGLWLSPTPSSPPILTLFGSTNLNSRSSHLDTELSFVMILPSETDEREDASENPVLHVRNQLAGEVVNIRANTVPWRGAERKVRFGTKMLVGVVGAML